MKARSLLVAMCVALTPFAAAHQTNSIIVPKEQANAFGDRVGILFSWGGFAQVYDPAEFAEIPENVIAITALGFRWDERHTTSIDVNAPYIYFAMGTSAYHGADYRDYVQNVLPVFETCNMRLTALANRQPSQFDVVFPLDKPFVYDRRRGRLVLEGIVSQISPQEDAQSSQQSFFVLPESRTGDPHGGPEVMVTQFFYYLLPSIESIIRVGPNLEIQFTAPVDTTPQLESSEAVAGMYTIENQADLAVVSPGKLRATIPLPGDDHFYRIRVD